MICPNCYKSNMPQSDTCVNCGHILHNAVFPSILSSIPPETISAVSPSKTYAATSQKPGCLGSLLKRALGMLAATIVGWLCGWVNAALLPSLASSDSAWLITFILTGAQLCLSFVISLVGGIFLNRRRQAV